MSNSGKFVLGAIFGAAVASVSALLFAPKSGEEFREELKNEFDDLKLRADEYKEVAKDKGASLYGSATDSSEDIKVNLKYSAENLKHQFEDVASEAVNEFKHLKDEFLKSKDRLVDKSSQLYDETKDEVIAVNEIVQEEVEHTKNEVMNETTDESFENTDDTYNEFKN